MMQVAYPANQFTDLFEDATPEDLENALVYAALHGEDDLVRPLVQHGTSCTMRTIVHVARYCEPTTLHEVVQASMGDRKTATLCDAATHLVRTPAALQRFIVAANKLGVATEYAMLMKLLPITISQENLACVAESCAGFIVLDSRAPRHPEHSVALLRWVRWCMRTIRVAESQRAILLPLVQNYNHYLIN